MAIDKLIPQYLNSDTDQKLVKAVEMTDNLNVRVSNDAEGTAGVIKNIKGTEAMTPLSSSDTFPTGDNRVIGSVSNEVNKEIIFLVWNSNQNHGIYRLDLTTDKYKKLYEDSVLGFRKYSYAKCDVAMNENRDTLFYWTDNINPPMKLNIQRLIAGGYPSSLTSGTDSEKLLSLTVAKRPPILPPSYNVINNPNVKGNNIKNSNFQFAYKYIYQDGEHSALSPYSSLTVATSQLRDGLNTDDQKNFFNQIDVSVVGSVGDVEKIQLYAREGNNGVFYKAGEVSNPTTGNSAVIHFTNETLGAPLGENERKKTFDNVPQVAKTQAIVGNRLMYGNYIEGYDNIDTDIEMLPTYGNVPTVYNLTATAYYSSTQGRGVELDYANIPATLTEDATVHINISYEQEDVKISGDGLNGGDITSGAHDLDSYVIFTEDSDDTDKKTKNYNITRIQDGIFGNISGLSLRAAVSVTAGMNRQQVRNAVRDKINAKYLSSHLTPIEGEDSFSKLNTGGGTPFTTQCGRFQGEVVYQVGCSIAGSGSLSTTQTITFIPVEANLRLVDFKDGTDKKLAEIVETKTITLDLDDSAFGFLNGIEETTVTINNSGSFLAKYLSNGRAFKSGSHHKLGVVYFDDRNRAGGVQEAGSVYVNALNDRSTENDLHGLASITMRLKHNAPTWAKSWAPVYVGRGETELKLFYSVKGAFLPKALGETSAYSVQDTIYLSLNNLFGKPDSYTKGSGADIEYKYEQGDRLRIVEYDNGQRTKVEFDVVDFVTLVDNPKTNPLLSGRSKDAIEATTGEFLVIRNNPDAPSFNTSAVAQDDAGWFKKCIVEIFRDGREAEQRAYYEIGKVYSANDGVHSDERSTTSVTFTLTSNTNGNLFFKTSTRLFKGDILVGGSGNKIRVRNVYKDGSTYSVHGEDLSTTSLVASQSYTFTVDNPETVVEFSNGDVYFRPRLIFTKEKYIDDEDFDLANIISSTVKYVEDYSVSDFFSSKSSSIGRAFAHIPDAKQIRRRASITYSDPYFMDTDRLNLSSFNLSLANWKDMNVLHGDIDALVNRSDSITCLQDSKVSQIPVNRNVVNYSDGGSNLTVSMDVLNQETYYAGDYGTSGNPESVVERFGVVYFTDAKAGKVVRLSTDGITIISDKGMNSFFEEKFKTLMETARKVRVIGGFDPDNSEYLVTVEPVYNSDLTVGSDDNSVPVDSTGAFTINGMFFTTNTVLWNIWGNLWNTFCGDWEDIGNGVVFVDSAFNTQGIVVDLALMGTTGTINVLVTDTSYSFSAIGTLDLSSGKVTLPATTCEGDNITLGDAVEKEAGFTISYKHKEGQWGSKYSFKPTNYVDINNQLFSFFDNADNKLMWKHNANSTRNNFYNVQYDSVIEAVSNNNPSMIKVFEALAVEGGGTWSATLTTSDQSTTIGTSDFDVREGNRYAMIPRDTLKSTSHQIYVGKVDSVSTDKVTFTTPVNKIPFVVGDILKKASGSTLSGTAMEISGISDRKTIQCTTNVTGIAAGDNIFVEHTARVDGDPLRDVFMKIKITSSDTTAFEVHALSLSFDRSRLHNDRVN